jgi:hypothetical protein
MRNHIPGRRRPWQVLLTAVMRLAGGKAELLRHVERPWASVTFAGTRHTITLAFTGHDAVAEADLFLNGLPDHEFAIPRQVVADAAVVAVAHETTPQPKLTVEVEMLLLEDV